MKTTVERTKLNAADAALHRVYLKRIIRAAGFPCDNEAPTHRLEAQIKSIGAAAPKLIADKLDAGFQSAADDWVCGNNSGDSRILASREKECDRKRVALVSILALFGIETDFPGLYPSFKVNGFEYHSTLSALRAAAGRQVAA